MTNLQHHLGGIRKIVRKTIRTSSTNSVLDSELLRSELRQFLPKSYGIGAGRLFREDQVSEPVQLLLYDIPLSDGAYDGSSTSFDVRHVLLVIDVAQEHDDASFNAALARIASVKRLPTGRNRKRDTETNLRVSQARIRVPSDRLPFALVAFDTLLDYPLNDIGLFEHIQQQMKAYPISLHPDDMDVISQPVFYRNPLLIYDQIHDYDSGLSRKPPLNKPHECYVCKREFFRPHYYYKSMCVRCGDLNYTKRKQLANLRGWRVLITGARVKIGFFTALRLLRAGAEVLVTSRFPRDTARRYADEADFDNWSDRLHVYGLDLRQIGNVELFIEYLYETYSHLDILINNAAQTVKRPPAYYAHLIPLETSPTDELPPPVARVLHGKPSDTAHLVPALGSLLESGEVVEPPTEFDQFGQPVDKRDYNSWTMRLDEVPTVEIVEVHLVNAIAPAILAGQLKQLLIASPHEHRHIINVSAAEGRFTQFKRGTHPHTNMAKAALNMLTRTIAKEYWEHNIYVNSVDPGWVSDQLPHMSSESYAAANQRLPIDMEDAAARICDLVFLTEDIPSGQLLKDYQVVTW